MDGQTAVTLDISLVFQTLQQFLDSSVLRFGRVGIESLAYLASSQSIVLPKQIDDCQFRVSQCWLFPSANPRCLACDTTSCRKYTASCRSCQGQISKKFPPQTL